MKKFLLFLSIFSVSLFAQDIPNAGFENWTGGKPDGWFTNSVPTVFETVSQSSSSHSGSSAVRIGVFASAINIAGYIWSGNNFLQGFPISQAYGSLNGYYQFTSTDNDNFYAVVYTIKNAAVNGVGSAVFNTSTSGGYNQFSMPITYSNAEAPDTAFIWFLLGDSTNGFVSTGSFALIDDLSWGDPTGVKQISSTVPQKFGMQQNYPNPFNPSTRIEYTIPEESFVQLKVYDIVGNELTTLVNEYQPAGTFRAEFTAANLSSGIYIAKLTAGSFTKTMKMTLLK